MTEKSLIRGKLSAWFARGYGRIAIGLSTFGILTFIKVYEEDFARMGIPLATAGIVIVSLIFITCLAVGYMEERLHLWGQETQHIWAMAGWDPVGLTAEIHHISQQMEVQKTFIKTTIEESHKRFNTERQKNNTVTEE